MKQCIILAVLLALAYLSAGHLWANDEANTSGRTAAVRPGTSATFEHPIVGTAEEIQDFLMDELQRNHFVKSDRILKTTSPFTIWATEAVNGKLTKPRVVFFDERRKIHQEWCGDEGELRVDAQSGMLELHMSETKEVTLAGKGLTTCLIEKAMQFQLPSFQNRLLKD
jgi:hypothetical protein